MTILDQHAALLERLDTEHRRRRLMPRTGLDFASNDYLGLGNSAVLASAVQEAIARGVPTGAGGSRLLRGNDPEHELLEAEAANFFGAEAALWFSSGFAANSTLFSALPGRRDLIVHDALIHASVHDGMRLGFAARVSAAHNDPQAVEEAIVRWRQGGGTGRVWIAVESLYSMDGDTAPLEALADIADRYDAFLVIDEAHAAGVFGDRGRGLGANLGSRENILRLITCGKALGAEGALLLGPRVLMDAIVNVGRGFIFSTAPSPLMASAVRAAIRHLETDDSRRLELHRRIAIAGSLLGPLGATSATQIMPLVLGDDARTMAVAAALQARGIDVRGIRPPTVPQGTSRLRISITLNVDEADILTLATALAELMRKEGM